MSIFKFPTRKAGRIIKVQHKLEYKFGTEIGVKYKIVLFYWETFHVGEIELKLKYLS